MITHTIAAFSRSVDNVVDYEVRQVSNYSYGDVHVISNYLYRISGAGEQGSRPKFLLTMFEIGIVSTIILVTNVAGRL